MWSLVMLWTWHCIRARDDRFALGRATFMFEVMDVVAGLLVMHDLTTPGVEAGLSRPRRDVLTTRRWGHLKAVVSGFHSRVRPVPEEPAQLLRRDGVEGPRASQTHCGFLSACASGAQFSTRDVVHRTDVSVEGALSSHKVLRNLGSWGNFLARASF